MVSILLTILLSSVKFAMTFPLAIYQFRFSFPETILWTNTGGILGILFFAFLSERLIRWWNHTFGSGRSAIEESGLAESGKSGSSPLNESGLAESGKSGSSPLNESRSSALNGSGDPSIHISGNPGESAGRTKPLFTRRNRQIVRVKQRYGLLGIAFLTPLLFSIPLGTFLAVRYYPKHRWRLTYLVFSNILWSVIYTSFYMFWDQLFFRNG